MLIMQRGTSVERLRTSVPSAANISGMRKYMRCAIWRCSRTPRCVSSPQRERAFSAIASTMARHRSPSAVRRDLPSARRSVASGEA